MTTLSIDDAEALFSAAYDRELAADEQRAFDATLAEHPELAQRYRVFCQTLETFKGSDPAKTVSTPDLLRGVQRRLRKRSGGRFYADRFSERAGWGMRQLLWSLLLSAALLLLFWLTFLLWRGVSVTG
jgi:anti-sigma factor RsiW